MSDPKPDKRYTFADYLTWPDRERYELFDGIPLMMTAPSWQHQDVCGQLFTQFNLFLSADKNCRAYISPFDLRLPDPQGKKTDEEGMNVYQPDITVICDKSRLKGSGYFGVPSLVVEVQSVSTGKIDRLIKFNAYEKAGVDEYWIVEPETRIVSVFRLKDGSYSRPDVYDEDDRISVDILPGLSINLESVFAGI